MFESVKYLSRKVTCVIAGLQETYRLPLGRYSSELAQEMRIELEDGLFECTLRGRGPSAVEIFLEVSGLFYSQQVHRRTPVPKFPRLLQLLRRILHKHVPFGATEQRCSAKTIK